MHPWQEIAVGCGLTLHAPLSVRLDPADVQADFAAIDAAASDGDRYSRDAHGEWQAMTLWSRGPRSGDRGEPTPLLAHAPHIAALLAQIGDALTGAYLSRQPPGGVLEWHFDNQALHLDEARLLLPICIPAGARTLIGDGSAAYPPGQMWAGDFAMPHQVENDSTEQRIVLLVDVRTNDAIRALDPPELYAEPQRRRELAQDSVNHLLAWRAGLAA